MSGTRRLRAAPGRSWHRAATDLLAVARAQLFAGDLDGCWPWPGAHTGAGYARRGPLLMHRLSYELLVGTIPAGWTIDHVQDRGCRSRSCVNPAHLEAVPRGVNVLRGAGPSALNAVKTACPLGHPLEGDNLYRRKDRRGRHCRECARASWRRWKARAAA